MKLSACLLVFAWLCPVMALAADPFNYDYVEADYANISPQSGSNSKGPGADVSYTLPDLAIQVRAGYARLTQPLTTTNNYFIGIRGENSFGDTTDFYTDILYLNNHANSQGISSTDIGYRLALGLRQLFSRWVEFDGSLGHDWLNQSSNDATAGLLLNATPWLAMGLSYSHSSLSNNTASLRLRVYF